MKERSLSLELFIDFAKIGAFTLGGGYAMLSLVKHTVVARHKWISEDEFSDMITVIQGLPGIFAVNVALFVGHKVAGRKGSLWAALGAVLPSILIIWIIAAFAMGYKDQPIVERVFKGLRPCVVALILAPSVQMAMHSGLKWNNVWMPVLAILVICACNISPVYVIIAAILYGLIQGLYVRKKHQDEANGKENVE